MNTFPAAALTILLTVSAMAQIVTDNCTTEDFQAIYVGKLLEAYSTSAGAGRQHAANAVKSRIAALLTGDAEKRAKLTAVSVLYHNCDQQQTSAAFNKIRSAAQALTNLAFASGIAAATQTLKDVELAAISGIDGSSSATARKAVYPDAGKTGLQAKLCTPTAALTSAAAANVARTARETKLLFHIAAPEKSTTRSRAADTEGKATICQSSDGACPDGAANGNKIGLQKGKIYTTTANNAEPKHGHTTTATTTKQWYTPSLAAAQITAALDTAAHTSLAELTKLDTPCNVWEQTADSNFIEAIATAQTGSRDNAKISEEKTKINKQTITETYGKTANEFQDKIWKHVEETPITAQNSGIKEDTTLKSISGLDQLLFLEQAITLKKKIEQQSTCSKPVVNANEEKPANSPKSAAECKKHTTQKPCKDETGCDFDETKNPKCFPNAETGKKDEKSFSSKLRVFVPQVFAALVFVPL
uniref:Variant surface glycoprotein 1125.4699 n=1 Tax=Trypanosoma brucei TaxID=5691 RepID=A0A1J0RAU7_9TRYP|nr:variant surface glycoprotein 1125.4699 [Trypanosoma brucei]